MGMKKFGISMGCLGVSIALAIVSLSVVSCSDPRDQKSDKLQVVTTFTILADIASEVAGDAADVSSITKPGADIHGYEPTPKDIVKARKADLVLWNGMNLEVWFEKFYSNLDKIPSATLTDGIEPLGITEGPYSGKPNPHAWMSPANAIIYVENIRKAFVEADPENAEIYNANAKAYSEKLAELDEPVRKKLDAIPDDQRWLVTSEGAFSYLCENYGLKQLYLWPINADAQGTPQQVRKVIDRVRENEIPVIFSESTVPDKPAKQVAAETGARYGGVLYVDSLTGPDGPASSFLKLMTANAETIVNGFNTAE